MTKTPLVLVEEWIIGDGNESTDRNKEKVFPFHQV